MTVTEKHNSPMIEPLTSLRFIFAIMIFFHHFQIDGKGSFFPEGYLGVTFFFILSGFIIALNYASKEINTFDFFIKRLIRLYPLHILCFFIAIIVVHGSLSWKSIIWVLPNLFLLQSWIPIEDCYFSFSRVSWCLSDEIFFYAMFPLVIAFIHKAGKKIPGLLFLTITIIYFLFSFAIPDKWSHSMYYIFPLSRLLDFIWGIIAYYCFEWILNKNLLSNFSKIGVCIIEIITVLVLVGFIIYSDNIPEIYRYGIYYWIPMLMLVLVFACFNKKGGIISRVLSNKTLVLLGNASFPFYMIHLLMTRIVSKILAVLEINVSWHVRLLLCLFLTIVFGILLFKKYEIPCSEYLKKRYLKKPVNN